jgi:hypothetical protein
MVFRPTRTVVSLDPQDILRLQEVLIDEDAQGALEFVRDVIGEKIRCAQDESHRPTFEGGIRMDRAHNPPKRTGHREGEGSPEDK